jgi:hypothetical protein
MHKGNIELAFITVQTFNTVSLAMYQSQYWALHLIPVSTSSEAFDRNSMGLIVPQRFPPELHYLLKQFC